MVINPVHCSLPFTCAGNYLAVPTWQTALLHSSFAPLPQMTLMLNGMVDRGFTLYPIITEVCHASRLLNPWIPQNRIWEASFSIWIALFLPSSSHLQQQHESMHAGTHLEDTCDQRLA